MLTIKITDHREEWQGKGPYGQVNPASSAGFTWPYGPLPCPSSLWSGILIVNSCSPR